MKYFDEIWLVDFEFLANPGCRPEVVCLSAKEYRSGRQLLRWADELGTVPPIDISERSLFVAFYASAELGCFRSLGWPQPKRILDLFTEFRCLTNGIPVVSGNGLIGALAYFGLSTIGADEKEEMRQLVLRGGPYISDEKASILAYCQSDTDALARLLPKMEPRLDLPRALLRGRYMSAVSAMEFEGVPLDTETLVRLVSNWSALQHRLIDSVDRDYGVFENYTFKRERFERWLAERDISWPELESGELDLQSKDI
jgi:DNA polymerase I